MHVYDAHSPCTGYTKSFSLLAGYADPWKAPAYALMAAPISRWATSSGLERQHTYYAHCCDELGQGYLMRALAPLKWLNDPHLPNTTQPAALCSTTHSYAIACIPP